MTMFVGVLYHPPKPIYQKKLLLDMLERSVEDLTRERGEILIALGGDFNDLEVRDVVERTGLQSCRDPTRGGKILDRFVVSALSGPSLYDVKVITSVISTDHKAIMTLLLTQDPYKEIVDCVGGR